MASLVSDSNRRDGYVRSNTLETNKYPTAELVVKSTPGLLWPLPSSGEVAFQIVGDMTIHGVTKELTWEATAQAGDGGSVTGTGQDQLHLRHLRHGDTQRFRSAQRGG